MALPSALTTAAAGPPHVEGPTRKQIPIPVCTTQLAPVKRAASGKAVIRSLDADQWMNVLIPSFSPEKGLGDKAPPPRDFESLSIQEINLRFRQLKQERRDALAAIPEAQVVSVK